MSQNPKAHERINQYNSCACKHVGSEKRKKGKIDYSLETYKYSGSLRSAFLKQQDVEVF